MPKSKEFQVLGFDGEQHWQVRYQDCFGWKSASEIKALLSITKPFPVMNYSSGIPRIPLQKSSPKKIRVAVTGIPGSGKTTISKKLACSSLVPYISVSSLAAQEILTRTPLGREIEKFRFKHQWQSLSDELAIALVKKSLPRYFVLDGFPLSMIQFESLMLGNTDTIILDTPSSVGYKRLIERGDEHEVVAPRIVNECAEISYLKQNTSLIAVDSSSFAELTLQEIKLKLRYHYEDETAAELSI